MNDTRAAVLTGTVVEPYVELTFDRDARHPNGTKLLEWVRAQPSRRWNPDLRVWEVSVFDGHPAEALAKAGWDTYDFAEGFPLDFDDLFCPLADLDTEGENRAKVYPRLLGYSAARTLMPPSAVWVRGQNHWSVDLAAFPLLGVEVTERLEVALDEFGVANEELREASASLAAALDTAGLDGEMAEVAATVGAIPDWFRLPLDPYQVTGALAAAAGHSLIGDEPGLGKTRQGLAAAAVFAPDRLVITYPPVVGTSWEREVEASGIIDRLGDGGAAVRFRAGRKEPALPDRGVVLVPDSLLAARPKLLDALWAWRPQVVIVDEAHRAKTWSSTRSKALRRLAASATRRSIALTGTPLFASPKELAGTLALSGHLDATFGGYEQFIATYCRRNHWKEWVPNLKALPHLREQLNAHVWVRRTKAEVATELPAKSRRAKIVDVDQTLFRTALSGVHERIDEWVDSLDGWPDDNDIDEWCHGPAALGVISPLRLAAGLAKVPVAVSMISDWVNATTEVDEHGNFHFTRPLVVWTHHHEVSDAMAAAVPEAVGSAGVIVGSTSDKERARLVDAYQAGEVSVLVCSIHAAGVGITLTRGSDSIFVETDWTPALISQAEDRQHRRTQTMPVTVTTLVAEGTLDQHIHKVLRRKIEVLEAVSPGADHHVAIDDLDDGLTIAEMTREIVEERLATLRRSQSKRQAA